MMTMRWKDFISGQRRVIIEEVSKYSKEALTALGIKIIQNDL